MPPEVHALVFDTYGTVVDWRSAVLEALEALGASLARHRITGLTERELDGLVQARWRLVPWPDAVPGLTRLKQRYVISPLSNASFTGMVRLAKFAGLPWDCVITAENARRYKPHPEVYRTAVALLGWRPDQVMLVAAHNYDLRAAQGEGLRTGFVPRPLEYGPGQTTDLAPEGSWDVVAKDFVDLAEKLG